MADGQDYLIRTRRTWPLWVLPSLGLLLVVLLVTMALGWIPFLFTDNLDLWAMAVTAVLVILFILEMLLLVRRRPEPVAEAMSPEEAQAAAHAAYAPPARMSDIELQATGDAWNGLRVLEASLPPKTLTPGGVYTKTYVQVGKDLALRVEDLVAYAED
ncbi:MAG TPA: hypothetical protein VM889_11980 [Candidatus Thermoplasmatota archaeon]|nr:hypothetical protein [Candidatus Thermoplasmatota archaeon]